MCPIRSLRDWTVRGLWLKTIKDAPGWFASRGGEFGCAVRIPQDRGGGCKPGFEADEANPARWDGTFYQYHGNCSSSHNSQLLAGESMMGHDSMHWQERQLSCLRRDHKPSKTPKAPSDWFLRLCTKRLNVMQRGVTVRACGKRQCQTSQAGEVPGCSQIAWTYPLKIYPLNTKLHGTPTTEKTRRRGSTGHCLWIHREVIFFPSISLSVTLSLFPFLSLSPPLTFTVK